ncbi:transcription factor IIA, alpha/beta subunit [Mycena haematopus]|nr:transcription factor IIA, alpha/beta subunit [Mycena haematopus]
MPQTDGPSHSDDDEDKDDLEPVGIPPRTAHPSVPTAAPVPPAVDDPEAINSDLDDSDSEPEDGKDADESSGAGVDIDIVFCTYDKVARVKNKWKGVLKDGVIHTGGKDYLFQKCTGCWEFEW